MGSGRVLIMLGICLNSEDIHGLISECPWVIVLENHASVSQELGQLSYPSLVTVIDPHIGAGAMAWNFFFPNARVPAFIRYLEDADLGREILRNAAAFADGFDAAFSFKPPTGEVLNSADIFMEFEDFLKDEKSTIETAVAEGQRMQPWIQEQAEQASANASVKVLRAFPAWRCAVVELSSSQSEGRIAQSLVKQMALQRCTGDRDRCLAAVYQMKQRFVRVVLRSSGTGPHVDEIGSRFGGCGHAHHAFFSVPIERWEELWAPPELVLWDVPVDSPSCLRLSRGDLVTIVCSGQRFRESAFQEWSWGHKTLANGSICAPSADDSNPVEGWVPSLSHTLFLVTRSRPSTEDGVESLEEGDLLVAWSQYGEYLWGSKCGAWLSSTLEEPRAWFFRDDSCLRQVHANSVRDLLATACASAAHGGA